MEEQQKINFVANSFAKVNNKIKGVLIATQCWQVAELMQNDKLISKVQYGTDKELQ